MRKGIITRLAFAVVFICFLLSTFVSLASLHIMARRNAEELSKTMAAGIYDTISAEMSEPVMVARTMANDYFLIDMLRHEQDYGEAEATRLLADYLSGLRDGLDCQSAFLLSAQSLRYYAATGESKLIDPHSGGRDSWYADFMAGGNAYDLDVDLDEFGQDAWTVFVDARIDDADGSLLGVCGVGLRMTGTQALFGDLERDYGVKISLVDQEGLVKVDTDQSRIETARLEDVALSGQNDYLFRKTAENRFTVTKYVESLGWYLVVESDGRGPVSQFIHVILVNVALCVLVMAVLVFAIHILINRTRALTHASFRDQTTKLLNRRAFEEEKASLTHPDRDFACVTADVNGLKQVNDTLGHAAGDELIMGAARCLEACLGRYGKVYRIGGDEFVALLKCSEEQLQDALRQLGDRVRSWRGDKVDSLSLSCGSATAREFPEESIAGISRISDERMYADKEAYYRASGKDRRRR